MTIGITGVIITYLQQVTIRTCLMSVYTSLRSSSNSLYGSIEASESVSVSCKVVKRRQ